MSQVSFELPPIFVNSENENEINQKLFITFIHKKKKKRKTAADCDRYFFTDRNLSQIINFIY